jgi:hypothetical protein
MATSLSLLLPTTPLPESGHEARPGIHDAGNSVAARAGGVSALSYMSAVQHSDSGTINRYSGLAISPYRHSLRECATVLRNRRQGDGG